MEKQSIRLRIDGVLLGVVTEEGEEYVRSLAGELEELLGGIRAASPYITKEAAALTAALSYADDAAKLRAQVDTLNERIEELEVELEVLQEQQAEPVSGSRHLNTEIGEETGSPAGSTPSEKKNDEVQAEPVFASSCLGAEMETSTDSPVESSVLGENTDGDSLHTGKETDADGSPAESNAHEKQAEPAKPKKTRKRKNPLRWEDDMEQTGLVSFFEVDP